MKKNETLTALHLGECSLVYTKLNGELRTATGTLKLDLIPKEFLPKNKEPQEQKPETDLVHYFDTDVKGWRCFWLENLQSLKVL